MDILVPYYLKELNFLNTYNMILKLEFQFSKFYLLQKLLLFQWLKPKNAFIFFWC